MVRNAKIKTFSSHHRYGRLLDAQLAFEHDRYVYELKVLTEGGTVLEVEYDAGTGALLEVEPHFR